MRRRGKTEARTRQEGANNADQISVIKTNMKANRRLTVRGEKEQRIVHTRAPLYCVDFLLYLQTLEVVELCFV